MGGHGYSAASAVGDVPAESVAGQAATAGAGPHGGPTVPCTTGNAPDSPPVALVVIRCEYEAAVQLTEIVELTGAGTATVGCFASELHSRTFPIAEAVKPVPETVTD